jgi:hypothetical protein
MWQQLIAEHAAVLKSYKLQIRKSPFQAELTDRFVWVQNLVSHIEESRLRAFENRALRIFGASRDEVRGEWRRLHNRGLYVLYGTPNITGVIKSRLMRWATRLARTEDRRGAYRV